jgi:hypothetical protein
LPRELSNFGGDTAPTSAPAGSKPRVDYLNFG